MTRPGRGEKNTLPGTLRPAGVRTCRQWGCREYGACREDDIVPCLRVEAHFCSRCAGGSGPTDPIFVFRACGRLRLHALEMRGAMRRERSDAGVVALARGDMVRLTCPGDRQRERDAALQRRAA